MKWEVKIRLHSSYPWPGRASDKIKWEFRKLELFSTYD
jgi:hypothetical protein